MENFAKMDMNEAPMVKEGHKIFTVISAILSIIFSILSVFFWKTISNHSMEDIFGETTSDILCFVESIISLIALLGIPFLAVYCIGITFGTIFNYIDNRKTDKQNADKLKELSVGENIPIFGISKLNDNNLYKLLSENLKCSAVFDGEQIQVKIELPEVTFSTKDYLWVEKVFKLKNDNTADNDDI